MTESGGSGQYQNAEGITPSYAQKSFTAHTTRIQYQSAVLIIHSPILARYVQYIVIETTAASYKIRRMSTRLE